MPVWWASNRRTVQLWRPIWRRRPVRAYRRSPGPAATGWSWCHPSHAVRSNRSRPRWRRRRNVGPGSASRRRPPRRIRRSATPTRGAPSAPDRPTWADQGPQICSKSSGQSPVKIQIKFVFNSFYSEGCHLIENNSVTIRFKWINLHINR